VSAQPPAPELPSAAANSGKHAEIGLDSPVQA
jgi:hypothetical protein